MLIPYIIDLERSEFVNHKIYSTTPGGNTASKAAHPPDFKTYGDSAEA